MKRVLLLLLIAFLIAGCAAPRESVNFSLERQIHTDNQIKAVLIDGAILGASIVAVVSLMGFVLFYFVGKKNSQ